MRAHLRTLERGTPSAFSKPCHLGSTAGGLKTLETYCVSRIKNTATGKIPKGWANWKIKVKEGYDRIVETLWDVAQEFDVRGKLCYNLVIMVTTVTIDPKRIWISSTGEAYG